MIPKETELAKIKNEYQVPTVNSPGITILSNKHNYSERIFFAEYNCS